MSNEKKLPVENKIYHAIHEELLRKEYHPESKAKAIAAAQGDKAKLKDLYLKFRYEALASQLATQAVIKNENDSLFENQQVYQSIKEELARKEYHPEAKAKAVAAAQGDKSQLKPLYLKFRYEELVQQFEVQQDIARQQKVAAEQEMLWQQDIAEQQEIEWQKDIDWKYDTEQTMTDEKKSLFEDELYRVIDAEMQRDEYDVESMARAIEQAAGNKEGLKALYVKYRYAKLSSQKQVQNNADEKSPSADEMYLIICEEISGKKTVVETEPEPIVEQPLKQNWLQKLFRPAQKSSVLIQIEEEPNAEKKLSATEIYQIIGAEMARKEYYPSAKGRASLAARGDDSLLKSLYVRFRYEELSGQVGQHSTPESQIYQTISEEMARKEYHVAHQKRAISDANGDNSQLKKLYIKFRYEDLAWHAEEKRQLELQREQKTQQINAINPTAAKASARFQKHRSHLLYGIAEVAIILLWLNSDSLFTNHDSAENSSAENSPAPIIDSEAVAQYRQAAEQGNAQAQFKLATLYENGKEIPQDKKQAADWYRKAAEQGHVNAQFKLGVMYTTGQGVAKNPAEAAVWYRKAAEHGFAFAQFALGNMYELGSGVTKDDVQAVAWYREAAEQDDPNAQFNLGIMYANGRGVMRDQLKAVDLFRKAAEQGFVSAQFNLGVMYALGQYVQKDEPQALMWFRKAAEQGDMDAQFKLAVMYESGKGTAKDMKEAFSWYRKSAEQGFVNAQFKLAVMYATAQGVANDDVQAAVWFRKAADQGDADAQFNLGTLYEAGRGVTQDKIQALAWYRKAAEQGFVNAQFNLGVMYAMGRDVEKDETQAMMWFRKAADQGDVDAQNALLRLEEQQGQ